MAVKVAFLIADDVQWNGKGPPRSLWQVSYNLWNRCRFVSALQVRGASVKKKRVGRATRK